MNQSGILAISVGVLIIFGSLMTALLVYRRKKDQLDIESDTEREFTLVHELRTIAETSNQPRREFPLTWDDVENPNRRDDSPAKRSDPDDPWKSWASEPFISPDS